MQIARPLLKPLISLKLDKTAVSAQFSGRYLCSESLPTTSIVGTMRDQNENVLVTEISFRQTHCSAIRYC